MSPAERKDLADRIVEMSNRLMLDLAAAEDLDWWCLAAARDLWRTALKLSRVLAKRLAGSGPGTGGM